MRILRCIWFQCLEFFEPRLIFYFSSNILNIIWFLSFVSHTSPCLSRLLLSCVVVTEGMMTSMMWLPWVVWTWLRRPRGYWAPQNLLGHRYGPVKMKFSFMLCLYNIKLGKLVSSGKLVCPLVLQPVNVTLITNPLMQYVCHSHQVWLSCEIPFFILLWSFTHMSVLPFLALLCVLSLWLPTLLLASHNPTHILRSLWLGIVCLNKAGTYL